jgi:hypothetical protein
VRVIVYNFMCVFFTYITWNKKYTDSSRKIYSKCKSQPVLRCRYFWRIVGAFAKLRKATVIFVVSFYSFVCMEQHSQWTDFHKILYLSIVENRSRKFKFQ